MSKDQFNDFVLWFVAWLLSLIAAYATAPPVDQLAISGDIDAFLRKSAGQAYDAGTGVDIGQTITTPSGGGVAEPDGIAPSVQAAKSTASFVEAQVDAMNGLLADIVAGDADQADIERRAGYYGNALQSQYYRGLVENAHRRSIASDATPDEASTVIVWDLGAAEDHCATCAGMAGKSPWTPQELMSTGIYPQSFDLDCKGFHCTCTLRAVPRRMVKSMEKRDILKSFAVKGATAPDDGPGTVKCVPSVMGNIDSYADVIFPGAFGGGCLAEFLRRGKVLTDHQWEWTALVGYPTLAEERGNKLYSEFTFHSDPESQAARIKCVERINAGKEVGLSIGFSMLPSQYVYFNNGRELLDYAKKRGYDLNLFDTASLKAWNEPCQGILAIDELFEYSLTPNPANREAIALQAKSASERHSKRIDLSTRGGDIRVTNMNNRLKTICGSLSLPLAHRDVKWSAKDAIARLKAHTGATNEPNAEFAKAFVVVDGPNDEFDSYKLPFADVVNGKMQAVFPALKAAAGALHGDRAGVELTGEAAESARRFVEGYYAKAASQYDDTDIRAPWTGEASSTRWKGQYLGEYIETDMSMSAMYEGFYSLYYECGECLAGYGEYANMSVDERMNCMSAMFDEYKNLCLGICSAIIGGDAPEDGEMAAKSVKRILTSQIGNLGDGLPYSKHARIAVDAMAVLIERTSDRFAMRRKADRELSPVDRQMIAEALEKTSKVASDLDELMKATEPRNKAAQEREARLKAYRLEMVERDLALLSNNN